MRAALLILSCAAPAAAQDFSLAVPIDCDLGDVCYIQNYVDQDPSGEVSTFQCGTLSYDGHKGTDFALPSLAMMDTGVDVLASAPGVVRGVRDDMDDVIFTPDAEGDIKGRDCGNGVVVAHDDGWETQYCHMKQGSVTVRTGDTIATGDILGEVGLSGRTQFPHLHLSVRRRDDVIDPFAPDGTRACDAPTAQTLWDEDIATPAGGLIAVGFADGVPDYDAVKAGTATADRLRADAPVVLWGFAFGARPGDTVTLTIEGPDGPLFETIDTLDRQQALVMRAGGLNVPDNGWSAGDYTGTVVHARDGAELDRMQTSIALR